MKKILGLIIVTLLVFTGKRGIRLLQKIRHAKRLKIGVAKFKLLNLSSKLESKIILNIGNFSATTFVVDQVKISVYTTSGKLLAEQLAPLLKPITLKPNQNNLLPINYKLNIPVALSELRKLGGLSSLLTNYITSGRYGLPIIVKGFVVSGNIDTAIEESLTV